MALTYCYIHRIHHFINQFATYFLIYKATEYPRHDEGDLVQGDLNGQVDAKKSDETKCFHCLINDQYLGASFFVMFSIFYIIDAIVCAVALTISRDQFL